MPNVALDGAHCFALRGASIIRIHQESDYITDFQVHLGVPVDYVYRLVASRSLKV